MGNSTRAPGPAALTPSPGPGARPQDEALPHECVLVRGLRGSGSGWLDGWPVLISEVARLPSHRVDPVTSSLWEGNESESV